MLPQPQAPIHPIEPSAARTQTFDAQVRRAATLRSIRHAAALAAQIIILGALLSLFFVRVPQVDGRSMAPQIESGDHVLINTVAYDLRIAQPGGGEQPLFNVRLRPVARGDVVAFVHGDGDDRRIYLKRVIGLPGDSVSIERGVVAVNGATLVEPYVPSRDSSEAGPLQVPTDSLFVLGDNRGDSDDSRSFGSISVRAVIGRAAFIVWPPNRVSPIR